ncbi:MAG TPA: hypothetical protein VGO11_15535 [Chthoniobacteraceae bacterium]|jgi:hypothetical protein|nr:hypothetical protein [Chthoniobacteraceae bacterium]
MKTRSSLECLEARIAPAAVFTFTDVDGDLVTVKSNKGLSTDLKTATTVTAGQLTKLDLSAAKWGTEFDHAAITITAKRTAAGGDGFVNVGYIDATGRDLASVTVAGDLGAIDAGETTPTPTAIGKLSVGSLGRLGTTTGAPDLESDLVGGLGSLNVHADFYGAYLKVTGGAFGKVGAVKIGSSLVGLGTTRSGSIQTTGDLGPVTIGGSLRGGAGDHSGVLEAGGRLLGLTLHGSLLGSSNSYSGAVLAQSIGKISIDGSVTGGNMPNAGYIESSAGGIDGLKIGGSLVGGTGGGMSLTPSPSGAVSCHGVMGPLTIGGDVKGNTGLGSGTIIVTGKLTSATVGGSLIGVGVITGTIQSGGDMGPVKIGGDLRGGSVASNGVNESGILRTSGSIKSLTIGGSLIGANTGSDGGLVDVSQNIGPMTIGGSIMGGTQLDNGEIRAGSITSLHVVGNVIAGLNHTAGSIRVLNTTMGALTIDGSVSGAIEIATDTTSLKIGGDLTSAVQGKSFGPITIGHEFAGSIVGTSFGKTTVGVLTGSLRTTAGGIGFVTIKGDDLGGIDSNTGIAGVKISGSLIGGVSSGLGAIFAAGLIGSVEIGGDVRGGTAQVTGIIHATGPGSNIPSVNIHGSLVRGTVLDTGDLYADEGFGRITIGGDILGGNRPNTSIDAGYIHTQGSIGSLTVGGTVEYATILAGYHFDVPVSDDAKIGAVRVKGDWIASSLVAGIKNTKVNTFGDGNDTVIGMGDPGLLATIASITIDGQVLGTPAATSALDHYGFSAEKIGAVKIGAVTYKMTAGKDRFDVGGTLDTSVRET